MNIEKKKKMLIILIMSNSCLLPRVAIQRKKGEKPIFLKHEDYEFYLHAYDGIYDVLLIPCGHCVNCLKRKSQEWTARLLKEMENHKFCYFITFTYNDENHKEINKRDIQLFLKRYRKKYDLDLKYYICGEHGETTGRNHYHAIFLQDKEIPDLKFFANNLYISEEFAKCWNMGNCLISKQVNERSIKYTIAYTLKKLGEEKVVLMSKGIGLDYFKVNKESIKAHDGFYVQNGFKQKPPVYFRRKLKESTDPVDIQYLKDKEDELSPSVLLNGRTIPSFIDEYIESLNQKILKGKGAF